MFRRGLVFQSECPDPHCSRVNCHFLHPQASNQTTAGRESSWKLLQDLKQVPLTQHDSYVPSVQHTVDVSVESDVDVVHNNNNDDGGDHHSALNAVSSRGVKVQLEDDITDNYNDDTSHDDDTSHSNDNDTNGEHTQRKMSSDAAEQHNKRVKHLPGTDAAKTIDTTTTPHRSKPDLDLMGPLIPSKKFTVDNFLGAVSDTSPTAQPISTQSKSARQRINPSSQSLSSATCPIVPYTPNSHIERAVRQKVVDRLYAHLTRVNSSEAVQQALDLELEIYRSCQGRTSYTHQARVLFSELERK